MSELHIDLETRSAVDLRKLGAHIYAASPTTDIWCAAYTFDDEPEIPSWQPGGPCPERIRRFVEETDGPIAVWNAQFERLIWRHVLGPRYGWPVPPLERFICVMAKSYALALPGDLNSAGQVMKLDFQKDEKGSRVMKQMAKPRRIVYPSDKSYDADFDLAMTEPRAATVQKDGSVIVWWFDEEKLKTLLAYNVQDVATERAADRKMLALRPTEQAIYELDQRINDRGVYIDRKLCKQALKVVDKAKDRLDRKMFKLTDGGVTSCQSTAQLRGWLREKQGVDTDSVSAPTILELLDRDIPAAARQALILRQEAAKSSVAKIDVMLARSENDGFARGNLQYHGATTGRWSARGIQLQNLPRPSFDAAGRPAVDQDAVIQHLYGSTEFDMLEMLYAPALTCIADIIRGMIIAPPGHDIYAADFSSIEARVLAWLAGQQDALEVFRRNEDVYCYTAANIYARPIDKKKDPEERQVGKVSVLALGYQGGVGAFSKMAKGYNVDLEPAFPTVWESADIVAQIRAETAYKQRGRLMAADLSREAWLAAELIKIAWRWANPEIVNFWWELERAAIEAVNHPGRVTAAGNYIRYKKSGSWLFCRLPSGRCIAYVHPKVVLKEVPWKEESSARCGSREEAEMLYGDDLLSYDETTRTALFEIPAKKPTVQYWGVNSVNRKWSKQYGYGGLFAENVTQAVSRDFMAEGALRTEAAGYSTVLTVHDELVTYAPEGHGDVAEFEGLMAKLPEWGAGCPVAADGWRGKRYRK